jgi:DNA-3-methyladenine glycosylase II
MSAAALIDPFTDVSSALRALSRRDAGLRRAVAAIGRPVIRRRPGGFEGLFRIVVEQQVSVPSAQAIWGRCLAAAAHNPDAALALGEDGLRALGLSRPKARYAVALAGAVTSGALDPSALGAMPDDAAIEALCALKGVGRWTAAIYLLFCEGRVDIWPPNDVALQYAYAAASGLNGKMPAQELDAKAEDWAPWRGVAAHILWTYYAHLRGRTPI